MTHHRIYWGLTLIGTALAAGLSAAQGSGYRTEVIAQELQRPTGIAVDRWDNVYFTELPTPGVPGNQGGRNTVSVRLAKSGQIVHLTMGEPEPTNLAVTHFGDLYWTCKSANVILSLAAGANQPELVRGNLDKPVGISTDLFGDVVFFTEVPTPGVPGSQGGRNGVFALAKGEIQTLSLGEPEPNDVVRTLDGTVYWTCTSAGVILQRSPQGTVSLLLGGLDHPLGITADRAGNLYFTEVPTPGIPGSMGGRNKVWRYNVHTGRKTLVDEGDPEPRDVAATVKGTLYWTCSSAGVIVRATPDRGGK